MESDPQFLTLLPPGFADLLNPEAGQEARIIELFMAATQLWGYERVKPPLIEYEESLLSGPGAAMRPHTFRLLDPISHRMMGLRADITPQIARIAASRLRNKARPLRLSYAGQVLRVGQEQLRPARQISQIGVELIGSDEINADGEVVLLAEDTLRQLGLTGIIIDLHLPRLLPMILGDRAPEETIKAVDRKDRAEIARLNPRPELLALLDCPSRADEALAFLQSLDLPSNAREDLLRMQDLIVMLYDALPSIHLTLDPTDHRFFDYHSGPAFTIYADKVKGEIGRGGRYLNQQGESATGFSFYLDRLVDSLPAEDSKKRLYISVRVPHRLAQDLRRQGWIVVRGLDAVADPEAAAKEMLCSHYWVAGDILAVN